MADYIRHLGELMGQSPAERAVAEQKAQEQAEQAASHPQAAPQGGDIAGNAPAGADSAAHIANGSAPADAAQAAGDHVTNAVHAASQAAPHDVSAYAFPFSAREVFGLLPDSIGGKVESLWSYAQNFSEQTPAFTMAVTGFVLLSVLIAIVSTARVWRRGGEVLVAGFGDPMTRPGASYFVRQDAPRREFPLRCAEMKTEPAVDAPAEPVLAAEEAPAREVASGVAPEPAVEPSETLVRAEHPLPKPRFKGREPKRGLFGRKRQASEERAEPRFPLHKGKPPKAEGAVPVAAELATATTQEPAAAKAEPKQTKTVRRQLFKRTATERSFSGHLQSAFGSYGADDRLFAGDYLRQTNEAFEAAHFKGKGPHLHGLRLSENHRAERLFMMAARTAGEDPSTALAALWQAVEEDSADAVAWLRLAHCYMELGQGDRAAKILEPLQAQAEKSGLPMIVAAAANSRGKIAAKKGDAEGARKLLSAALTAAEESGNPFLAGICAANLGLVEGARGKRDQADAHLAKGIKSLQSCEERVAAARFQMALGAIHRGAGDAQGAERIWREASDTLHAAKLPDEAARVDAWLRGEEAPNKVTL